MDECSILIFDRTVYEDNFKGRRWYITDEYVESKKLILILIGDSQMINSNMTHFQQRLAGIKPLLFLFLFLFLLV